jgi:DNA-binding NarL/FixJ family response regulator
VLAHEESLFRDLMRSILDRQPHVEVVAEVSDGMEAARQVQRHHPDVALLSAHLDNGGGIESTRRIKEIAPSCRVLIIDDKQSETALMAALEAGASGYLTKSSSSRDLLDSINSQNAAEVRVPPEMHRTLLAQLLERLDQQAQIIEHITRLTPREREILSLLVGGASTKSIALRLVISPETARTHIQNILEKLGVHSRLQAVAMVRRDSALERLIRRSAGISNDVGVLDPDGPPALPRMS